ncbi:hypothetical protein DWV41_09315 [Bacteroides stercoris]|uniref:Uncharacterized protein n=1 Tax=Bacteroides stercoris TaxID=46506 RepID=A0A412TE39_BACSE|nr:hypothetical protein DWW64_08165 [Bacteroides stercoris]RGW96903.1 hypothetical protein DWV41_09315 [Bacteroides stercoris]RHD23306.1 hypothetical protein DW804_09470 [Bacteroides stercoris]
MVFVMPRVGTCHTTLWYGMYHTVVLRIPHCGTRDTNGWYSAYQAEVFPGTSFLMIIKNLR